MTSSGNNHQYESLSELEQIEGNYYKMDLFVSSSLVVFTIWVFLAEKNFGWTLLLGVLAILFLIRGIRNWKKRGTSARSKQTE
jgi:hypothetical protein